MTEKSVCKEENLKTLYEEHISDVRNFMFYKTGDLENAEDLAQDSFIKMWENCGQVVYSKAKSFLFTVANRLFLNSVRHEKVKLSFVKTNPSKNSNETPEYLMEENEFKTKLEISISSLPEKQREVFLMNRIDKMSYNEIAKTLEISVKTVEKRMGICLKTLKNNVEELNTYKI